MLLELLAVPVLIALNAFFVVAEYAIVAVRSSQIEQLRTTNPRAAVALRLLKRNMGSAIGTSQLCITLSNLLLGWVGEPALTSLIRESIGSIANTPPVRAMSIVVSFLVVTLLTVVLAELVPKAITLQHTMTMATLSAQPLILVQRSLKPLVWIMNTMADMTTRLMGLGPVKIEDEVVTVDELRHITSEAAESGNLTLRERTLILNSLTLGRRTAREVMVPRVRANVLDVQKSMQENLDTIGSYLYSRMPLCDGGMDHVIGVVYTKEFLTAYQESGGEDSGVLLLIARKPTFVPVNISLDKLLQRFHDDRTHMVFLVDEHGGVKGIVTLTDVVNELLGPMHEGADSRVISQDASGMIVKAEMPVAHLADYLKKPGWPTAGGRDVRSVGGLLVARVGRVPRVGDSTEIEGVQLTAHKTTSRSVTEVRVDILPLASIEVPHIGL